MKPLSGEPPTRSRLELDCSEFGDDSVEHVLFETDRYGADDTPAVNLRLDRESGIERVISLPELAALYDWIGGVLRRNGRMT